MLFNTVIRDTLATLASFSCQTILLPESLARIERKEVNGTLVMKTQFLTVADLGELRVVHIYSPKINVLTLFFFPFGNWQLPVYCMELVAFGGNPIVAVLDTVCLLPMPCSDSVRQFMTAAHDAHPQMLQAEDAPDWFGQCRSGHDFFIRPENNSEMLKLGAVHLYLLSGPFNRLLRQAEPFNGDDVVNHQNALQNYKHHHRIHSPGLRLMNRSFGEQWTSGYMDTFFR